MKKALNKIDNILLSIAAALFFLIFAVSIMEIVMRGVFGFSLLWTVDMCVLLATWSMLLGGAVVIHRNDHLVVDFLVNMLPKKYKLVLTLVTRFLLLSVVVVLTYNGIIITQIKMGLYYTSLRWPTGYAYAALPVFGFSSILFLVDKIIDLFKQLAGKTQSQQLQERG